LPTRIAATEGVSLCEQMKWWVRFLELKWAVRAGGDWLDEQVRLLQNSA
jgi:hypothetical protein